MPHLLIVFAYLPLLVMAFCVILLFRRTGFGRKGTILSSIPFIVIVFSLLAVVSGERPIALGPYGSWALAAVVAVLTFSRWPSEGGRS